VFTRIAIVNRGEAAMRLIRAVRELSVERGSILTTIAMYTDVERTAMFVREADEAVRIYSADKNAYLDYDALAEGLRVSGAEAVWVGWGFVSEDPGFADMVEKMGLTFIGPSGDVMRRLGDKIGAKRLAEEAGVPVAPWSGGPVSDAEDAQRQAEAIGYPLMVKAAAGGGGRGIREVSDADGLTEAFDSARREAKGAFGDDTLFMERIVTGGRHVEVQIIADGEGGVWALGVRDCSIQRRHQKVIEESSSTALDADTEQRAKSAATQLAEASGYRGAGTVEFLYQPAEVLLAFLEVNTRLQVEHPVTEITAGVDLVKLQLDVAAGGRLEGDAPEPRGHAIEVRLNAEDPEQDFAPAPGTVEHLVWASGPGVRVDTGLAQGDVIPSEFDSMIAKVIGSGATRDEARSRVLRALRETTVVIRGGMTNKAFLAGLLEHPDVVAGRVDTTWLDRLMGEGDYRPPERRAFALVATAIDEYEANREAQRNRFFLSAARGRPQTDIEVGHEVAMRVGGSSYTLDVYQMGPRQYRLEVDDHRVDVTTDRSGPFERRMVVAGVPFRVVSIRSGAEALVEIDGLPHRVSLDDGGLVRAPSPGVLVDIAVSEGDEVDAGDRLATLESMKMEVALRAPVAGRVREVMSGVGAPVDAGSPLFGLDSTGEDEAESSSGDRADFSALVTEEPDDPATAVLAEVAEFRAQVLGYDYTSSESSRTVAAYEAARARLADDDVESLRAELTVLDALVDVVSLSRNRPSEAEEASEEVHSPREFFNAFLRTMDATRAGLPPSFEEKLLVALKDYEVRSLERTSALEEALLWMYLAQARNATQLAPVLAILGYRLDHPHVPDELRDELLDTLDRVIVATQVRFPVVGDLARSVRFRIFDEPLIEAGRNKVLDEMSEQLAALAASTDPEDRAARMEVLVTCPLPLIRLMARLPESPGDGGPQRGDGTAEMAELVEVQTRRYYQIRNVADVASVDRDGRRMVTATFDADGGLRGHGARGRRGGRGGGRRLRAGWQRRSPWRRRAGRAHRASIRRGTIPRRGAAGHRDRLGLHRGPARRSLHVRAPVVVPGRGDSDAERRLRREAG